MFTDKDVCFSRAYEPLSILPLLIRNFPIKFQPPSHLDHSFSEGLKMTYNTPNEPIFSHFEFKKELQTYFL